MSGECPQRAKKTNYSDPDFYPSTKNMKKNLNGTRDDIALRTLTERVILDLKISDNM